MTLSIAAFSIMTLSQYGYILHTDTQHSSIATLSIMTLSLVAFSIMTAYQHSE
jgi:hypothetical protein